MRRGLFLLLAVLTIAGCSETGGGTGPDAADQTCRDWCANEPQEFSCFVGSVDQVAGCYHDCLATYGQAEAMQCGDEWIAILGCELDFDCYDLFGECQEFDIELQECIRRGDRVDWCEASCPEFVLAECIEDPSECNAARYCEASCPTQDPDECAAEYLATNTCSTAGATSSCRQYCPMQDLDECIAEWTATERCEFETAEDVCRFVCPEAGVSFAYCVSYYDENGVCPEGPPPPLACAEANNMCQNGEFDPIEATCMLPPPPTQANACDGNESLVNPSSCSASGSTVTHQLTAMQVHQDCNGGYDLDSCEGNSCQIGGLASGEGMAGVDNALAGLAPVLAGVGGNIGGVDQAFHDGLCAGAIDLEFVIDANPEENCATVEIRSDNALVDTVLLNLSDEACLSGALGSLPLSIAGVAGSLDNAVVRMTVSAKGFSDGLLGGTADEATATAIAEELIDGGSAVVRQVLDINEDLDRNSSVACNAISLSADIGGAVVP